MQRRLPVLLHRLRVLLGNYSLAVLFLVGSSSFGQGGVDSSTLAAKARRLMGQGNYSEAAKVYARLQQAISGDVGLIANHGMALHMAGRHADAIPKLRAALVSQPGQAPLLFMIGTSYLALNQPREALKPLRKAVEVDAKMLEARGALAHACTLLGRHTEATEHLRAWTAADPGNPAAWYRLGASYAAAAQASFSALEKEAPESAHMVALAAEVQFEQKRYNSSFALYREALARRPGIPGAHLGLAKIYELTGHVDWAAIERAKEPRIDESQCAQRAPACSFQQGRYLDAAEQAKSLSGPVSKFWQSRAYAALSADAFNRLSELPPSVEGYEAAARMHRERGRHGESVNAWRAAVKLRPGDPALEKELAVSLHMNRDYAAALPILERLVAQFPSSPELNYSLGHVLVNSQRPAEAVERLELVARREPGFLPARASLGLAYLQLDKHDLAIPHLEAALPSDGDGSLHFRLSQAYQRAGQADRAKRALARYQEIKQMLDDRSAVETRQTITPP